MAYFSRSGFLIGAILVAFSPLAQPAAHKTVQPVGLIFEAQGGKIKRRQDSSWLELKRGDILFAGDSLLLAPKDDVQVAFCPARIALHVQGEAAIAFSERNYALTKGSVAQRQDLPICSLPDVYPDNEGGDDYGPSLVRALEGDTGPVGTFTSRLAALAPAARAQVEAGRGPLDTALASDRSNVLALLARATLFERQGLAYDASQDLERAAQLLGNTAWMASLRNTAAARGVLRPPATPAGGGNVYAAVIGVSTFANLSKQDQLMYADADAKDFSNYLALPRGGNLKEGINLTTLIDDQATVPAIKNALATFLVANATPKDTIILFMASHGVIEPKTNRPYLLTSESDLQKLSSTAIPMEDVLDLLDPGRSRAGRILIFIDVCHAAYVGNFRSRTDEVLPPGVEKLDHTFVFAASRGTELSREDAVYGGGHGAFSYFLLRGLNTQEANEDPNSSVITLKDLIPYVVDRVYKETGKEQRPQEMGYLNRLITIVPDVKLAGIKLLDYPTHGQLFASNSRGIDLPPSTQAVDEFRRAIAEGRILPGEPQSAFDRIDALRRQFGGDRQGYLAEENRLRVALETAGERVLLQYLKGDEIPQSAIDFDRGAMLFNAAAVLTPEAHQLRANALFCQGRALISAHRYAEAMPLLEEAARLTPAEAYVWNALGIGYLQIPDYARAVSAFEDAIRRAPFWAYPRHNLALALRERGNLAGAIAQYLAAIPLAPDYAYLRYNLGLLYQQINDRDNAAKTYREALNKATREPARARIMIAQALLETRKHGDAALRLLDEAAKHQPEPDDLLALRYDRALILAENTGGQADAEKLWLANLAEKPEHLPSLIALAEALDRWGDKDRAIAAYAQLLRLRPDYLAARLRLAQLTASSDPEAALRTLRQGFGSGEPEPHLEEMIGDLSLQAGDRKAAVEAYCAVFSAPATARDLRSQVRGKLKRMQILPDSTCAPTPAKR